MTAAERGPLSTSFDVVRRGFDPEQVTEHLDRLDARIQALAAARDDAAEHAALLSGQLDTARGEVQRLRDELRAVSGPPDSVKGMSERLQVMLRLAHDEFDEMRGAAQREVDGLCSLRARLAEDLDASRELIDRALPTAPPADRAPEEHDGHRPPGEADGASTGAATPVLEPVQVPALERAANHVTHASRASS